MFNYVPIKRNVNKCHSCQTAGNSNFTLSKRFNFFLIKIFFLISLPLRIIDQTNFVQTF
jgi:hypothetical protein